MFYTQLSTKPTAEHRQPTANTTKCLECDSSFPDGSLDECENCWEDGVVEYAHVAETPLGMDDDDDYLIKGRNGQPDRWEYPVDSPAS